MDTPKVLTVTQINTYIKSVISADSNLKHVLLEGEISNLTNHYSSGHLYFSLKDDKCVISAVMFKYAASQLKFIPENGMKVICRGKITLYEPSGRYQIQIEDMQIDGIGILALQFEQLKEKLNKKGYFEKEHKKDIPTFPNRIGVITSDTGAAVQDIKNILRRRYPCAQIIMASVLVQGENAPKELTEAVNKFNKLKCADVIIIGRGGGSIEDLWAFNSEMLADAIYNSDIPVISAVGHETDFTICDFVSDLRAPTPSAAAELCVPDKNELLLSLDTQRQYLKSVFDNKFDSKTEKVNNLTQILMSLSPKSKIEKNIVNYNHLVDIINNTYRNKLENCYKSFEILTNSLETLNPVSVLKRGFSYISKNGKNVSLKKDFKTGENIDIKISDGNIKAKVEEVC